jgi:hypothetical protein
MGPREALLEVARPGAARWPSGLGPKFLGGRATGPTAGYVNCDSWAHARPAFRWLPGLRAQLEQPRPLSAGRAEACSPWKCPIKNFAGSKTPFGAALRGFQWLFRAALSTKHYSAPTQAICEALGLAGARAVIYREFDALGPGYGQLYSIGNSEVKVTSILISR